MQIAADGAAALERVRAAPPDLLVSDINMPMMDGYELCRRLRADSATALLPVILITSTEAHTERIKGIEAGADDFLMKPVNWPELFGRVKRLLRVKALQDEIKHLNAELEERVRDQVSQLQRLGRLKRFFSRQVAEAIVAGGEDSLKPHRREITAVFLDLRGFTAFTDRADPDEVLELLRSLPRGARPHRRRVRRHARALRRRRHDDLLQRPVPGRPAGRARGAHGDRAAEGFRADRRGVGQARPPGRAWASASRRATPRWG